MKEELVLMKTKKQAQTNKKKISLLSRMKTNCVINPLTGRAVKIDGKIGRKIVGNKFFNFLRTRNQLKALVMEKQLKRKK